MRFPTRLSTPLGWRTARGLLALVVCGVSLGLGIFSLAREGSPEPSLERVTQVAFLQQNDEPAQTTPPAPTPAELHAKREARVAELAARLAAGRDATFVQDLEQLILESQQQIAAETREHSIALTAAQYENCSTLEQAMFDSGFALQYFENAIGSLPIPHIISINFPAFENPHAPNSSLLPAENWNIAPRDCSDGDLTLVDDRGAATPAELWFESAGSGTHTPLYGGTRSDQALMQAGIRAWWNNPGQLQGPPVTVEIKGLHLAMQNGYQVYVYMGMGISDEHSGGAPFHITIGENTPLFGGRQLNVFNGEWVRIDSKNGTGNYLLSPLLAQDKLIVKMQPIGFYPDTKLGCTAINGIQIVGARSRTSSAEEEQYARAAVSARAAQNLLMQASQQITAAPPPAEVMPNAVARLARLAKWQERVADQIEALHREDYAAVITALQQELAEVPPTL